MMKKILCILLGICMVFTLTPITSFAATKTYDTVDTTGEAFKSFDQDGVTYYDIYNGQTKDRPRVNDTDELIDQALYGKKDGQKYSAAEYWAAYAAAIFAANPQSWRSYNNDGGHGKDKSYSDFANRMTSDPEKKKNKDKYGDVQKWLSSKKSGGATTDDGLNYRRNDINVKASGKMTAKNLKDV